MSNTRSSPIVLIADDDPDDRLMIKDAFDQRCDYCRISFTHDGVQLMRVLHGTEPLPGESSASRLYPDLILLDLNMPLKDGREALWEIKSDPRLRAIPTIVMTTSGNENDIRDCYNAGANSYIIKPSSYSGLLDVVSSLTSYWATTVTLPTRPEHHDQQ